MIKFDYQMSDLNKLASQTAIPSSVMLDAITAVRHEIQARTERGVDVNGKAFKPYSKAYIESEDFMRQGKNPNKVNLMLTGRMRNSIMPTRVRVNNAELEIQDNQWAAYYTNKTRKWWGICNKSLQAINRIVNDYLKRVLR
jgi:hypothetical protein